jgi:hypothetical protein
MWRILEVSGLFVLVAAWLFSRGDTPQIESAFISMCSPLSIRPAVRYNGLFTWFMCPSLGFGGERKLTKNMAFGVWSLASTLGCVNGGALRRRITEKESGDLTIHTRAFPLPLSGRSSVVACCFVPSNFTRLNRCHLLFHATFLCRRDATH